MQAYLSMADSRAVDEYAIQKRGIPGVRLMEAAGLAVVRVFQKLCGSDPATRVLILTGKGNNAGDGYVIATELMRQNYQVSVLSVIDPTLASGDAAHHLQILQGMNPDLQIWDGSQSQIELFQKASIIFDALLGTGVQGNLRPPYPELIKACNASKAHVIAVDVPSGLTGDMGEITEHCVKSSITVSMGYGKQGSLFYPAKAYCGKVIPVDIGFPADSLNHIHDPILYRSSAADFDPAEFTRAGDTHKYRSGKVTHLAGSKGYSGAAVMAAMASLRSGAGLVKCAVPESIQAIVEGASLETIVVPLPDAKERGLVETGTQIVVSSMEWADVVAMGPGLGRQLGTLSRVRELVQQCDRPLVLDADALYALKDDLILLQSRSKPTLLTPHGGELKTLLGTTDEPHWKDAHKLAMDLGVWILLKGGPSILIDPLGNCYVNSTGNPGMATAGSGDVLTGILAGLWSQWPQKKSILQFAVYIHGAAADLAVEEKGVLGLNASDIIEFLPQALKEYGGLPN